jgi:hypothetical protein
MLVFITIFLEQVLVVVVSTVQALGGIPFAFCEQVVISYILRLSGSKVQKHLCFIREMLPHIAATIVK